MKDTIRTIIKERNILEFKQKSEQSKNATKEIVNQ
jgi:hypothetical protein